MPNEMKVLLRGDVTLRNDPGPPLNKKYGRITVRTSREEFVFVGEGDTARGALGYIQRAYSGSGASDKLKRCHAAVKADRGGAADIVFAE